MMDLIDRNLIGDLVDSNGNVHYEDIMNIPSLELPSVRPVDKDINVSCKDAISRQDAIYAVDKLSDKPIGYLEAAIDVLVDLPSVQPDIIRCKDCKHWMPYDWMFSEVWLSKNIDDYPEDEIGCTYCDMNMGANDFCSRGERKTDEY